MRVLLVEDNDDDALLIKEALVGADHGEYTIVRAERLAAAVAALNGTPPDVLLLDLGLPDSRGLSTLVRMQGHALDVPIVVLTGLDDESLAVESLQQGAQDYLVKDRINSYTLSTALRHAVERQHMLDQMRTINQRLRDMLAGTERLVEFSREINRLNFSDLLSRLREALPSLFRAQHFSIFLFDFHTRELRLVAHNHPDSHAMPAAVVAREDDDIMWDAVNRKELICVESFSASPYSQGRRDRGYATDGAVCVPLIVEDAVLGVLNLTDMAPEDMSADNMYNIERVAGHLALAISNSLLHQRIEDLALTDELTRLFNRRYLMRELAKDMARAARYGHRFSLLILDLDHFKQINDIYGHTSGDKVLREVAAQIQLNLRVSDLLCRFGGEEFVVVLPNTVGSDALCLAGKLRAHIEQTPVRLDDGQELRLTLSVGVAEYHHADTVDQLLNRADAALYAAKRAGRNACRLWNESMPRGEPSL